MTHVKRVDELTLPEIQGLALELHDTQRKYDRAIENVENWIRQWRETKIELTKLQRIYEEARKLLHRVHHCGMTTPIPLGFDIEVFLKENK